MAFSQTNRMGAAGSEKKVRYGKFFKCHYSTLLSRTFFGQKKKQVESWSLFAKAAKSESTSSTSTVRQAICCRWDNAGLQQFLLPRKILDFR